jgi:hypothetical protein
MFKSLFDTGSPPSGRPGIAGNALSAEAKVLLDILGSADPYGSDPHFAEPHNAPYAPEYIALLYVRLEPDWNMVVNHACYAVPDGAGDMPHHDQARLNKATAVFQEKLTQSAAQRRDVQLFELQAHVPYKHMKPTHTDPAREYDSVSLKDFKFASQNEIFIFLHHPTTSIQLVPGDLIGFSAKWIGPAQVTAPNGAFFNAKEVAPGPADAKLIRMRNYAVDAGGNSLPTGMTLEYSMDIKFQVNAGGAGWVTMIIDPDTGNGSGYEP